MEFLTVLDPGHGGKDVGAFDGIGIGDSIISRESYYALDVALYTEIALKRNGVSVKMTRRDNEIFMTPAEKAAFANAVKAQIFVSIHFNGSTNEEARGLEVFHYTDSVKGLALATHVYRNSTHLTPWKDRGIKHSIKYTVLSDTDMPAILVEGGFLSNTDEEKLVASPGYRKFLGESIAKGICEYFKIAFIPEIPKASKTASEEVTLLRGRVAELTETVQSLYKQIEVLKKSNEDFLNQVQGYRALDEARKEQNKLLYDNMKSIIELIDDAG